MRLTFLKKIFQPAPGCLVGQHSVLHKESKIINNLKDPSRIKIGANSHIRGELFLFGHGGRIEIGDYCYLGQNSILWSAQNILVGDRVLISHNVNIFDTQTHPLDPKKRHEHFKQIISSGHPRTLSLEEKPVKIHNDVWIACMAIILPGVTIGEGAVIGAGSVVTKDIPSYTFAAGNPARVIKEIIP